MNHLATLLGLVLLCSCGQREGASPLRRRSGRGAGDAGESVAGVCGGSTSACPPLSLLEDGALAFNQSLSVCAYK